MHRIRRITLILAAAITSSLLAGCTAVTGYPIFDRSPSAEDRPSAELLAVMTAEDVFSAEDARLSATVGGTDLFVLRDRTGAVCLGIDQPGNPLIACGGGNVATTVVASLGQIEMGPGPMPETDGWEVVSHNIRVEAAD